MLDQLMMIQEFQKNEEKGKESIKIKLVGNAEYTHKCVYRQYANLYAIPMIQLEVGEVFRTMLLTPKMLEILNLTEEEVFRIAFENIRKDVELCNILDELTSMHPSNILAEEFTEPVNGDMYVLSNSQKCCGAACILLPEVQAKLFQIFKDGFYILPSSIHELIILNLGSEVFKEIRLSEIEVLNMVKKVNTDSDVIRSEDILSNSVYQIIDRKLTIIAS